MNTPVNFAQLPQTSPISVSAAGDNILVTGVAGRRIFVTSFMLVPASAVSVTWKSGASTLLSGAIPIGGTGQPPGLGGGYNPAGALITANPGDGLVLNLGSAVAVTGMLTYFLA